MSLIHFPTIDKKGYIIKDTTLNTDDISESINPLIDKALETRATNAPKRTYLGASMVGEQCLRKIQYMMDQEQQNVSGKTVRIFDIGHLLEDKIADWLNESGFIIKTKNDKGKQFGFSVADGEIAGHIDGVVKHIPLKVLKKLNEKLSKESKKIIEEECNILWECKTLNASSWRETKKYGVFISKPIYYTQVQLYMAYMNFDYTLFTAFNKDSAELYHEIVSFNAEDAQIYSDKAVKLLLAKKYNEQQPRLSDDQNFYLCRMCGFKNLCHQTEDKND